MEEGESERERERENGVRDRRGPACTLMSMFEP